MLSLPLSYNHANLNEHYVTLPTCLLKTLTSITNLSSVNSLTTLEKIFFLKIVSTYQMNKYQPIAIAAKEWGKSIGIHNSQITMSGCEVLHLQKSLEKKGFLQVKRSKNHQNMDLRNILTPLIPRDLFDVVTNSSSHRTQDDSGRSNGESDLQWILRTKLFVPIRYDMLKDLLGCQTITANHKLFLLRNYLTAFKNFQVTGKLLFSATTKELVEKSGMSRATIFRILKTIRDSTCNNLYITHQYLNSDDIDSNRRDKSVFKLTFNPDFLPNWARHILPIVSGFKTMSLKIPPLYNKEKIIKNTDKKKFKSNSKIYKRIDENETFSFLSTSSKKNLEKEKINSSIPDTSGKVLKFYPKRTLKDWYPLSKEEVGCINWDSGREFSTNFANQLLLKLSKSNDQGIFPTKYHLRKYLTKVFKNELRQGPDVNHDSFKLKSNLDLKNIHKQKASNQHSLFQKKEIKQKQANGAATISNPLWEKVCEKLKSALGEDLHKSWTGKLEYLDHDKEINRDNNIIRLKAPSRFIGETIKDRYFYNIRKAFDNLGIDAPIVLEIPERRKQEPLQVA